MLSQSPNTRQAGQTHVEKRELVCDVFVVVQTLNVCAQLQGQHQNLIDTREVVDMCWQG